MLGDLMRENGMSARVLGTRHGAVIGVGQNILQMHIEVPQSQAGEATDFLEAYFRGDGALEDEAELADVPGAEEPGAAGEEVAPRLPLFAAGLALVLGIAGGGHWYSRRPYTAALLAAGQVVALLNVVSAEWHRVAMGLVMLATIVLLDLAGSQVAVQAYNRGIRRSPCSQLVTGALFLALAGCLSAFLGPHIPEPGSSERRPSMQSSHGVLVP